MSTMSRIMLAAPSSGSGKTMLTCGMLAALSNRQLHTGAMKCGPDYIDPMFHRKVLGVSTGNLDSFFMSEKDLRECLARKARENDITIVEGVMGYYDGLGGTSTSASAYEIAKITKTKVILIVDCKGASVTLAATIKGIMDFRPDSSIAGILLNRISEGYFAKIKSVIEQECGVPVVGYVPVLKDMEVPSRHLGLKAPEELKSFRAWADTLAGLFEKTIDFDQILAIAGEAEPLAFYDESDKEKTPRIEEKESPVIAVARDEAFSFYYDENMDLLEEMGAKLQFFSPLKDDELPAEVDGLILGGGYPELYAKQLSENKSMRESIQKLCAKGLPCIAECGGFLYLQKSLEGEDGVVYPMCDLLPGEGFKTTRLQRFGYIEAKLASGMMGNNMTLRGHEFHYWDCTKNGENAVAYKPTTPEKTYQCIVHTDTLFVGFPHFNYYSNSDALFNFVKTCGSYKKNKTI